MAAHSLASPHALEERDGQGLESRMELVGTEMRWGGAGTTAYNAHGGQAYPWGTVEVTLECGGVTAKVRTHLTEGQQQFQLLPAVDIRSVTQCSQAPLFFLKRKQKSRFLREICFLFTVVKYT